MRWFAVNVGLPGHRKFRQAVKLHRDAPLMWLALRAQVARDETLDGRVHDDEIDCLGGAPNNPRKPLAALVSAGLIDRSEDAGGVWWSFHDFSDHAREVESVSRRRERDRKKKQRVRGAVPGGHVGGVPRGHVADTLGESPYVSTAQKREEENRREEIPLPPPADADRETMISPGFKLPPVVIAELAAGYRVSAAAIERSIGELVSYWTLGGGSGKRRSQWPRRARDHVKRDHESGKLAEYEREVAPVKMPSPAVAARLARWKAEDDAARAKLIENAPAADVARAKGIRGLGEGIG